MQGYLLSYSHLFKIIAVKLCKRNVLAGNPGHFCGMVKYKMPEHLMNYIHTLIHAHAMCVSCDLGIRLQYIGSNYYLEYGTMRVRWDDKDTWLITLSEPSGEVNNEINRGLCGNYDGEPLSMNCLSLSTSLSLYLALCLSLPSISLYFSLALISLYFSFSLSLSRPLSRSRSLSLPLSLSRYISISLALSLSISLALSLSLYLSISLSLSISLYLSISLSLSISLYLSLLLLLLLSAFPIRGRHSGFSFSSFSYQLYPPPSLQPQPCPLSPHP